MKKKPSYFNCLILAILLLIILVPAASAANKIIPVGDSITQGITSGVIDEEFQISYRKALYDKLKTAGYVINDEIFVGTLFSGESVADFDPDHDGHPGWRADEIVAGRTGSGEGTLSDWLVAEEPNIVLLHIGTNDVSAANENAGEIENILTVIDDYEFTSGKNVWVILALIVNRGCDPYIPLCPKSQETTDFNDDVRNSVFLPRQIGGDNILLVDMENGAGINYERWDMGGDMWDDIHPFETGYNKMADLWYTRLLEILPQADAGPDQDVNEFENVTLDASGSDDPKNGTLTYQWAQTAGTPVVLSDDQAIQPTFDAPIVGPGGEILTFKLTVIDADSLESTDTIDVTILNGTAKDFFYTPVAPCRIVDTRSTAAGIIGAFTQRNFKVHGPDSIISAQGGNLAGCPSPLGEPFAAHINLVAVNPTGKGNLQAFPVGAEAGAGLSVNYNAIDTNLANAGTVKTVTSVSPDITVASNFSSSHTVIDVLGYYYPDGDLLYSPVTPCRIVDTRNTTAGIIGASDQRNFNVFGPGATITAQGGNSAGCPSPLGEPLAVHINMIAVDPNGKGNLQAFPVGAGAGAGLSVNYNTIDINLANAGTVKTIAGTGPDITVASNFSSAHTAIDVLGYYYPDVELLYTPVTPCRIIDTRKTSAGIIGASTQRNFNVFGSGAIINAQGGNPAGCSSPLGEPLAAHVNMIAVTPTGKGNLQAFPVGAGAGAGLSVNYNTINTNLANAGTVKTTAGAGPDISVASNFSSAHTVMDVLGYYYLSP